jgi:hypothetical protein
MVSESEAITTSYGAGQIPREINILPPFLYAGNIPDTLVFMPCFEDLHHAGTGLNSVISFTPGQGESPACPARTDIQHPGIGV